MSNHLIRPRRATPLIKPLRMELSRRGLLTGMAAMSAYAALPRDAEARWRRKGGAGGGGGGSYSPGVLAASLQSVVDQKTNGTVGLTGATPNNSQAFLEAQGAWVDYIAPSVYFFGAATISNFDFTVLNKPIYVDIPDADTVTFTNCKLNSNTAVYTCMRPGNNTGVYTKSKLIFNHCDVNGAATSMPLGWVQANYTMFRNTETSQYFFAGGGTTDLRKINLDHCVMTMSTQVPASGTHEEFIQIGGNPTGELTTVNCLLDVEDTVGTNTPGAGWSGVLSTGVPNSHINLVVKGVKQVNDWCVSVGHDPIQRVANSINYNEGFAPVLTNCVLGNGPQGRCHLSDAGSQVPSPAGGVYDYDTGALLNPVN